MKSVLLGCWFVILTFIIVVQFGILAMGIYNYMVFDKVCQIEYEGQSFEVSAYRISIASAGDSGSKVIIYNSALKVSMDRAYVGQVKIDCK
jgi:hypothetical protein